MSKGWQNALLLLAVMVLIAYPLLTVREQLAEPGKDAPAMFVGTDAQAEEMIRQLAPDYQPWAAALMTPPGGEIESLLFALQMALGTGFLGYYLGVRRERARRSAEAEHGRAV